MDFLEKLAGNLLLKHGKGISDLRIVFPNRRSGLFFKLALARQAKRPIWAPQVEAIEDLVGNISGLENCAPIDLIFHLSEVYQQLAPGKHQLASFYFWAELLIKDFDELDKYLVNPEQLFTNLALQHELDSTFWDYLSDAQKEAIKTFWANFNPETRQSEHKDNFLDLWHYLPQIYNAFKSRLFELGAGYSGMKFRQAHEMVIKGWKPEKQMVFAGFNSLNQCEFGIITNLIKTGNAEIYWDSDAFYLDNQLHEAGLFMRNYRKNNVLKATFPKEIPSLIANRESALKIDLVAVSLEVGQARAAGQIVENLVSKGNAPNRIAIVLPNQDLLFPVLHSLPKSVKDLNVTMGFPLKATPLYSLLVYIIDLQLNVRKTKAGKVYWHHSHVLGILRHPYFLYYNIGKVTLQIKDIEDNNRIYLTIDPEDGTDLPDFFPLVFKQVTEANAVFDYVTDILVAIYRYIKTEQNEKHTFEEEYIWQVWNCLKSLKEVVAKLETTLTVDEFWLIFKQMLESISLPFTGEPLKGLQILGVLESRNLDFDHVIVLSMNEGSFPPTAASGSFIPHNLRKGFGMPTYTEHDANYAYYFYRLLHRSQNVTLLYNAVNEGNANGQLSRFALQLEFEGPEQGIKVNRMVLGNDVQPLEPKEIVIEKQGLAWEKLNNYLLTDGKRFKSLKPAAVNSFIDCSLKFYFRYILGLGETGEVSEEMDASDFGNVLHKALEEMYGRLMDTKKSNIVEPSDYEEMKKSLEEVVNNSFHVKYGTDGPNIFELGGRNIIVRNIILKYVNRLLEIEKDFAPFKILGLESRKEYHYEMNISVGEQLKKVALQGVIDRIDEKDGLVRVIDYKTGSDEGAFKSVESLFAFGDIKRPKAVMQVLFYAMLYLQSVKTKPEKLNAGLFRIKDLFSSDYDYASNYRLKFEREKLTDVSPFMEDFEINLRKVLESLFDQTEPFQQTENLVVCESCTFKAICHR